MAAFLEEYIVIWLAVADLVPEGDPDNLTRKGVGVGDGVFCLVFSVGRRR